MTQAERLFEKYAFVDGYDTTVKVMTINDFQLALDEALKEQRYWILDRLIENDITLSDELMDAILNAKVSE